jgi:hypothetical protein
MKGISMNWNKPDLSAERLGRAAPRLRAAGLAVAGLVLAAGCSSATAESNTAGSANNGTTDSATGATVKLIPGSGSTSSSPTWATSAACPSSLQGSAIFRAINSSGETYDISQAVNGTNKAFSGTLQANIATIQSFGGIHNGATQELVILCFSHQALTGTDSREEHMFIHYSADGKTYTTSPTQ